MHVTFFATPGAFRAWLRTHHARETELWVGFYKKDAGKPTITWSEAVDEALCYGWIDGIRKSVDAESYTNRFTPRKKKSNWSAINLAKMKELIAAKRVRAAGIKAYEARDEARSRVYSFDRTRPAEFEPAQLRTFRAKGKAWAFWEVQPPGYRRLATHYVVSAKRPETRAARLTRLIRDCTAGIRITQPKG